MLGAGWGPKIPQQATIPQKDHGLGRGRRSWCFSTAQSTVWRTSRRFKLPLSLFRVPSLGRGPFNRTTLAHIHPPAQKPGLWRIQACHVRSNGLRTPQMSPPLRRCGRESLKKCIKKYPAGQKQDPPKKIRLTPPPAEKNVERRGHWVITILIIIRPDGGAAKFSVGGGLFCFPCNIPCSMNTKGTKSGCCAKKLVEW